MPKPVMTTGAMMQCSFGLAPSVLNVLPIARTTSGGLPVATIADAIPMVNIPPFGMCSTLSNPMVAAATAAALGVLTPMPCIPVTEAWIPQSPQVLVAGKPVLVAGSQCMCNWGGVVTVTPSGGVTTLA